MNEYDIAHGFKRSNKNLGTKGKAGLKGDLINRKLACAVTGENDLLAIR